jgi:hypothetical protein
MKTISIVTATLCSLLMASPAAAEPSQAVTVTNAQSPIIETGGSVLASDAAAQPSHESATLVPGILADTDLDQARGGDAIVVGNQTLIAITQGSVLNGNYNAGSVAISDSALSSFNGIGNILINTGALNNLQSGMNVTINLSN